MKKLRLFEVHGVLFSGTTGDEAYGTCPFTNKPDKFYVNTKTWLWDSKTAGKSGNISQFLKLISQQYEEALTPQLLKKLSDERHIPEEAFPEWHIGWNGSQYTIPVFDAGGTCQDIRMFRFGGRVISSPGVQTGLLGANHLAWAPTAPIYICEGEWDAIALQWLLRKTRNPGVAVGVPGAGVFKPEWAPWFTGRDVYAVFDHDEAGENGDLLIQRRLSGIARRLFYTHWPSNLPTGFDVRNWIIHGAVVDNKKPNRCFKQLQELFRDYVRKRIPDEPKGQKPGNKKSEQPEKKTTAWTRPPSFEQVCETFAKWLFLDNTDAIEIMLAVVLSMRIDGSPVWVFLVGSPGSAKTECLSTLAEVKDIYMTSSLTPHALISGANWADNVDPSLIPRLDHKIMVIKDFTSILTMRDADKDEIFGILRDAYDGRCGKVFGTGVERQYESRFTILAAVTPRIYDLGSQHASLGERFLKFTVGDNLVHTSEADIIARAIDNVNKETAMKEELADVVEAFLTRTINPTHQTKIPDIPDQMKYRIIHLARFGARMRGVVSRDNYRNDIITSRPSSEVGSRLGIQLAKMAKSLAMVHRRNSVSEEDYRLLKKIMLDTIPQRTEDIIRQMILRCPTRVEMLTTQDVSIATRYPVATVVRILQDLHVLDIVRREGSTYKYRWGVSDYIRDTVDRAGLYKTPEEQGRKNRVLVRAVNKRSAR